MHELVWIKLNESKCKVKQWNSQIYFVMKLCMFRRVCLSIFRSLFIVHSAMVYVIQVCRQLSRRSMCSCSKAVYICFTCISLSSTVGGRARSIVEYMWTCDRTLEYIGEHTLPPTRLLILMHVKHPVPYLYIQPSSWRWNLGFETCRRHQQLKIKILV